MRRKVAITRKTIPAMFTKNLSLTVLAFSLLLAVSARAQSTDLIARTNQPTLNDLIRPIPIRSWRMEEQLASLSAIQEQVVLHERKMRGEGLPPVQRAHFSANYSSILNALIDDRITEQYGRDLLDVHRQLVCKARAWSSQPHPEEQYGRMLIEGLKELAAELSRNAEPLSVIPDTVRTPMINGNQLWIEELLIWGSHCNRLSPGDLGRLGVRLSRLEQDERNFKRDGYLSERERERLHARLIDLQRILTEELGR